MTFVNELNSELANRQPVMRGGWLKPKTDQEHQAQLDDIMYEILDDDYDDEIEEDSWNEFTQEFGLRRSDEIKFIYDLYRHHEPNKRIYTEEFLAVATFLMCSEKAFKLFCRLRLSSDISLAFKLICICRTSEDAEQWLLAINLLIANGESDVDPNTAPSEEKTKECSDLIYKFSMTRVNSMKNLRQFESTMDFFVLVYGIDSMISALKKVLSENVMVTVSDFHRLIANWEEVHTYPVQWAISVTPEDLEHYIPESDINEYGNCWKETF